MTERTERDRPCWERLSLSPLRPLRLFPYPASPSRASPCWAWRTNGWRAGSAVRHWLRTSSYCWRASPRRPSCSKAAARSSRTRPTMPQRESKPAVLKRARARSPAGCGAWPGSRRRGSRPGRPAGGGRWHTCASSWARSPARPGRGGRRRSRPGSARAVPALPWSGSRRSACGTRSSALLSAAGPVNRPIAAEAPLCATWIRWSARRHPHRLGRALPHLAQRRGRNAGRAVQLAQRHPPPASFDHALGARGRAAGSPRAGPGRRGRSSWRRSARSP